MEMRRVLNVDLSPLDALYKLCEGSPSALSPLKIRLYDVAFQTACLMDSALHVQVFQYVNSLKKLRYFLGYIGSVISSFDLKEMDQDTMAGRLSSDMYLSSLEKYTDAARETYSRVPKPSRNYYPRTCQLGFIDHLAENLGQLVKDKADSIGPLKYYALEVQRMLQLVSYGFMEISESRKEEADLKDLIQRITDLAYEAEYVIDSFQVRDKLLHMTSWGEAHPSLFSRKTPVVWPFGSVSLWLRDILQEFEQYQRRVKMESGDMQSLVSSIIDGKPGFKIIPIVNDTEISKKLSEVFNHHDIRDEFSLRTWSLVSSYKERKKKVFLQLLQNVSDGQQMFPSASFEKTIFDKFICHLKKEYKSYMSEDKLKISVRKLLTRRRYFIILEDVRDIDALNDIRGVFPDDEGCRLLLTTPSPELALQCHRNDFFNRSFEDHTLTSQTNKPTTDDDVIGFKVESERMLELLIGEPTKRCIISIVGMAGQGKTTFAKKLYRDSLIVSHFHIRSWCFVSQIYEKRELLLELLGEIVQHSRTIHNKNDEELAEMLYKNLKGRRFLILLDDIWTIDAWNALARCFPNDNNGSRIIFTTRIQELATQAKSDSILQALSPLSHDESWELLRSKVFQKESCPHELLGVGRQIAENCRGLPLSVVLTSGFLAKMEKKVDIWEHIAKTLSSRILSDAEAQGKRAIELSYKHLPDPLKPCFLYFGAFLEDREILVCKLIRLWIAEGFIKRTDLKSLEDVAEDYLMNLVGRSLVIVAQEKSYGGVKACRVHDLIREFCLTKAWEDNFLQQINGYDEYFSPSNDNLDYGKYSNHFDSSTTITYHIRRLSIYAKRYHFARLKPSGPSVQSLLFFASSGLYSSFSYDISFIVYNFKILKILDLEEVNTGNSFEKINVLVLLRYLAVQGNMEFLPSSIANLSNLETFLFKGLSVEVVNIPDSIWDMAKLRHLHINNNTCFYLKTHKLENSSLLENLQTLSTPSLAYGDDMEKILSRLRAIRKLKCIFLDSWDDAKSCNQFPKLGFLNQLVSLKVFYNGEGIYPCQFNFPSNLKKLTLTNFHMPWNEISQLAALSNLEVLKLLDNAFEGETWEMEDEMFPKLKFLKLKTLNVVKWNALSDHFPRLERLILHTCKQLEEIPSDVGYIPTLEMIEVMWCSTTAAISAKSIQEEQLDFGNEGLKIFVHPKVWDL